MSIEALRGVIDEVVLLLAPLVEAAQAPDDFVRLLSKLGWTVASVPRPLADLAGAGASLLDVIGADADDVSTPQVLRSIGRLVDAVNAIHARPNSEFPASVDIAAFKQTIGRDLLDYCVVEHMLRHRFKIGRLLKLTGIVQLVDTPASGLRQAYVKRFVDWSSAGTLLTDPVKGFRTAYAWDTAAPQLPHVLSDIAGALEAYGLDLSYFVLSDAQLAFVAAGANPQPAGQFGLSLDLNEALGVPPGGQAGVQFVVRPATPARAAAVAILPYAQFDVSTAPVDDALPTLSIRADIDLAQGFAITLEPGHAPVVNAGFLAVVPNATPTTGLAVQLRVPPAPDAPERVLVGSADSSHLSLHTATISTGVALAPAQQLDAFIEIGMERLRVVVKPDNADSFTASLLGGGLSTELSLALRLSTLSSFHIAGSASLEANFPLSIQLGPVSVQGLTIGLQAAKQGADLNVGATLLAHLGPVAAVADRAGFSLAIRFPDPPTGNLGPVDLSLDFLPPSGVGLSVDAQGVLTGGGFLFHDKAQSLYAGAMQLSLHERITLKAFGLIATRLPDGSPGYSLIVFITAEDFQPIPLGLGFTLLGIGGMVGVNRTFDEEVLRQGLKSGTLATLLFPRDPVGNASALIQALSSAFPARRGSYLLGLLAKIGWFTPTLVLMDLALILEFGARNRLLALGHISALLPSANNDLVRLNMEAMGVIDFDAGTAAIDAVLLDSRLAHKFAITGAAALRAGFASGPSFVLAVGGLNPHFAPPAGFPTLERVAIALSSGDNPRLLCQAYFAITSNTVQFGAAASLYASAAGFSVQGDVGFDVLVQLLPLHFIADYHAKLQLKYGSHNLFMVTLDGELEGPRPLRISGKASFEIFWCDFSVQFDTTLVRGEPPPLPAAVDVLAQLRQALALPASWHIERSLDHPHGVALRSLAPSSALVLDPLGQLSVTQQTVPLNTGRDVDTFSGAPVAGARRFALTASLNGTTLTSTAQQASFAPAQYFTMSDDEKLAAPAFEAMDAGCTFGSAATQLDVAQSVAAPLTYRTIVIGETPASTDYVLNGAQLRGLSRSGAAARAPLRRVGRVRFANTAAAPAASLLAPRWTIAPNGDGAPRAPDPALRSWSDYHAAVITLNRASAIWQLLPSHELEP
jgi:hypothetical protein